MILSNRRIEIIIQEINYWKEHKILPEMYCDFLLALYTKGRDETKISISEKDEKLEFVSILQLTTQFFLLLTAVVVLNMQNVRPSFQTIFLSTALLVIFWLFKLLSKKTNIYFHLSITILLVQLFLITIFLANQYVHFEWIISVVVICNFICWFMIGFKYKLKYLQIIAVILMVFTIFYSFLA